MGPIEIAVQRLDNQMLVRPTDKSPGELVTRLGAVQAQDYPGAKWSLGQRLLGVQDAAVEQAYNEGSILRTHLLRPTWHFVSPADIRWMLALTGPRVHVLNAYYYRKLELDDALLKRANAIIAKVLRGGRQLTRPEIGTALHQENIATTDIPLRFGYIMMHAELDGIVCSGARRGKQHTYALLEDRVPQAKTLERDEALAELTRRYFISRGPATVQDFVWWSGLSTAEARAGLEAVQAQLVRETIQGKTYWFPPSLSVAPVLRKDSRTAYLLPDYDEYFIAYKDRSAALDPQDAKNMTPENSYFSTLVIDGQTVGTWKREIKKDSLIIHSRLFHPLNESENQAFVAAMQRYSDFLGLPVVNET